MHSLRMWRSVLLFAAVILLTVPSCIQKRPPEAPVARMLPRVSLLHGVSWTDNYYWLRERNDPEVMAYLEAENAYADEIMAHTKDFQEKLYDEMISRIVETDLSVPEKEGDYLYYWRTEEGLQYDINCRRIDTANAPEEIILDENKLAEGHDYFAVGEMEISPDQQLLAYSVDTTGGEIYSIYVKNLTTGEVLEDHIPNTYYSFEWAGDNKTIFYTIQDDARRSYKLFRHELGTDYNKDEMVYWEQDQAFDLTIDRTKDKYYLLMELESNTTSEVHFLKADNPKGNFAVIHPRQHKMQYSVSHHDDRFFIVTNDNAPNFKLMVTTVKRPGKTFWKEYLPYDDSVMIAGVDVFKDFLAVYERRDGLKRINVINLSNNESHYVRFPEPVYTYFPGANRDFNSSVLRLRYYSLVTPRTILDYDMKQHTLDVKKEYQVLGGYDKSNYRMERIYATAKDGAKVPMSIVYRKGLDKNGKNPFYLYGYGAYGISSEPYFSSDLISLLDRGFVMGIAHVRGGDEMGRQWYEQGRMLSKMNTFTDFVACAEHVIAERYTSSDLLVASGASAGGLLVGAVANMRPDLFKVIVADVPFVDVINTMLDPSIPLTVIEYEEWGNPNEKEYFDYMRAYSPYDNVRARNYPHMLVTAGLNDARVQYWEPAKWTAKLRAAKTDKNRLLLRTNMGAGHGGSSGRYDEHRDVAFEYAFILDVLGIKQ